MLLFSGEFFIFGRTKKYPLGINYFLFFRGFWTANPSGSLEIQPAKHVEIEVKPPKKTIQSSRSAKCCSSGDV